jgi:hypothetical protein
MPSAQSDASALSPWPHRVVAAAFLAVGGYSIYLAARLLSARCEGFSCTYLGMAWLFWLAVLCLPTTGLGYLAQRSKSLSIRSRLFLRFALLAHTTFAAGLLAWWVTRGA